MYNPISLHLAIEKMAVIRGDRFTEVAENGGFTIVWVPSRVGIKGNERADRAAKAAVDVPKMQIPIPASDVKSQDSAESETKLDSDISVFFYINTKTANKETESKGL